MRFPQNHPLKQAPKAVDGRVETCWVEDQIDDGIGEYLEVKFQNDVYIGSIGIVNGFSTNTVIHVWLKSSFNPRENKPQGKIALPA